MAGIYNPWANPETDETLSTPFATPDLMATGNPLSGGSAEGLDHEPMDEADDEMEDASDPNEEMEDAEDQGETEPEEPKPMMEALAVIQHLNDIIKMLLEKLKA